MNELATNPTYWPARYPRPIDALTMLEDDDETEDEDEAALVIMPRPELMPAPVRRARKSRTDRELPDLNAATADTWPTHEVGLGYCGKDKDGRPKWVEVRVKPVAFESSEDVEAFIADGPWLDWADVGRCYSPRTVNALKRNFALSARERPIHDLNSCSTRHLLDVPGIGWAIASTIVELRPYASWDDLLAAGLRGVTPRLVAAMRATLKLVVPR